MSIRSTKKKGCRAAALLFGSVLLAGGPVMSGAAAAGASSAASLATASYTAQSGDTFWLLSQRFGVPLQALLDANPGVDPMNIYAGLKLNIPQTMQVYTAQQGDTFWLLSQRFGVPLQTLLDANPGVDPMNIYAGLKLNIPQTMQVYTAQQGDTFWLLSQRFGVPLQTLLDANPGVDPLNVYTGLKLRVPLSSVPSDPPPDHTASAPLSVGNAETAQSIATPSGETLEFVKALDVVATAYSASLEENQWGPVDYFGNPLKLGTIAVDPGVIPFGSKLYITGYNFNGLPAGGLIGIASDTGSTIKGNRIDIFVPGSRSYVSTFGIQNVKVYILK